MKTVLIGAGGQLATDLEKVMADWNVNALHHKELDICNSEQVRSLLINYQPNIVINTAAYHHVDTCEEDWGQSFNVNAFAPLNLAKICRDLGATLVHMSTDYVFSGDKGTPYVETDPPNPVNVYGISKVAGEFFVQTYCPNHIIIRSSGLFGLAGSSGKGGNFIETMVRLAREEKVIRVVDDQVLSPTYTMDLAEKITEVIQSRALGIIHLTNQGSCSWYEFAGEIFNLLDLHPDFGPTTTDAYGVKAARPAYSVLENAEIRKYGIQEMRSWKEALRGYLEAKDYL